MVSDVKLTADNNVKFRVHKNVMPRLQSVLFLSLAVCVCLSLSHTHTHTNAHTQKKRGTTEKIKCALTAGACRGVAMFFVLQSSCNKIMK